jgi:tetratricopeptide (TPR) repeat protein
MSGSPIRRPLLATLAASVLLAGLACTSRPAPPPAPELKQGPLHHYRLAREHFEAGRLEAALEELDRSIRLDPGLPQVHRYRGMILWSAERWEEAAESFERAIRINPHAADAWVFLAGAHEQGGRPERALAVLDAALEEPRLSDTARVLVNRALMLSRRGRVGEALADLDRAVAARPRYHRAHFERAALLEELARYEEALEALDAAAPGYERDPEFHYRRGALLFRLDRRGEAARELERAVQLEPASEAAERARQLLGVIE